MSALRLFLACNRTLAALILMAALALRIAVPAGYMLMQYGDRIVLTLCSGYGPVQLATPAAHHMQAASGMVHAHHDQGGGPQADSPCAFADLALPMLGGADPILLAAAILYILATAAFAMSRLPAGTRGRLRPPPTGPPITA